MTDDKRLAGTPVHAEPELLAYWQTLPAASNEVLAVQIIETLQRELAEERRKREIAEGLERMALDQRDKAWADLASRSSSIATLTPGATPAKQAAWDAFYSTAKRDIPHNADGTHSGTFWVAVMEAVQAYLRAGTVPSAIAVRPTFKEQDADMLAAAVDKAVRAGTLDARSEIADCRLDYGQPFSPETVEAHLSKRRHGKSHAATDGGSAA